MCRNIHTLFNFEPPATQDEVRGAALQYVRKVSGFTKPSRANEVLAERVHRGDRERGNRRNQGVEGDAVVAGRVREGDAEDDEGGERATSHRAPTFAASSDVPLPERCVDRSVQTEAPPG